MVVFPNSENNHASDHAKHIQAGLPEGHLPLLHELGQRFVLGESHQRVNVVGHKNKADKPPVLLCHLSVENAEHNSSNRIVVQKTAIPGTWDRLDANGTKRQSGETYRKRGRITFSSVL
jgi:hypothetical protein